MKEHKTYLVPTLYLGDWLIENAEAIKLPKPLLDKAKVVLPQARINIGKAIKAGVPIAFGTDAAVYPHGLNAREFAVLVKLGMTPAQAIRTADRQCGRFARMERQSGQHRGRQVCRPDCCRRRAAEGCQNTGTSPVGDERRLGSKIKPGVSSAKRTRALQ